MGRFFRLSERRIIPAMCRYMSEFMIYFHCVPIIQQFYSIADILFGDTVIVTVKRDITVSHDSRRFPVFDINLVAGKVCSLSFSTSRKRSLRL